MDELIWPTEAVAHMWNRHQTTPAMANEALDAPDTAAFIPDPKSRTGKSSRCNVTDQRIYQEGNT